MERSNRSNFEIHEDPIYFREAVISVAQKIGFLSSMIEKDYYSSLILAYLYQDPETNLVFKGGTCLSKVYVDFYRMSKDLDCKTGDIKKRSESIDWTYKGSII